MSNYTKTKIIRYKDDFGDDINLQALDDDGNAFNLTGYTVEWRVAEPNSSTYKFLGSCVIVTASEGKVKYTVNETDFDQAPKTYNSMLIVFMLSASITTATRARTSNVATITTGSAHGLAVGEKVKISGVGGTGYNGTWIVKSVPNATTFTYDNTGSDETQTADTNGTTNEITVEIKFEGVTVIVKEEITETAP